MSPSVDSLTATGQPPSVQEESFEQQLDRLEVIVNELENDALGLSPALERYEEGMRLARTCLARLDEAELRIKTLSLE